MTLRRYDIPASKLRVAAKSLHKDKCASPLNPQDRCWHFGFVTAKELASAAEIRAGTPADLLARPCSASIQFLAITQAQPEALIRWRQDSDLFSAAVCAIINQLHQLMRCYLPAELSSKPRRSSLPSHFLPLSLNLLLLYLILGNK